MEHDYNQCCRKERKERKKSTFFANLVQSKTDGLHVLALLPFLPAVLLHEGNHKAAVWIALHVWVLQHDLELRIQPKTCWRQKMKKLKCFLFRL